MRIPDTGRDPGLGTEKTVEQINTAIPLVARRENYADRLSRWMRQEYGLDWLDKRDKGRDVREWIPVTERLPDEEERCVVLADGGPTDDLYAACAVWRRSRRGHSEPSWHIPNVNIHRYFDGAADLREVVTHWMPLPPPPK